MSLNSARADSAETDAFLDRWHTVGLVIRHGTLTGTLFLDGKPLLDGVPLVQGAWAGASPDIIVRCAAAASVRIEDLEARYKDSVLRPVTEGEDVSQALVKDSFEGYPTGVFPDQGGWRAPGAQALGLVQDSRLESGQGAAMLRSTSNRKANSREGEKALAEGTEEARLAGLQMTADSEASLESGKAAVDDTDSVTGLKSFRIETDGTGELVVAKRLSLPSRVPFGVSEGNFVIGVAKTASLGRTISRSRLVEELSLGDRSDRSRKVDDRVSRRKSDIANEEQVPGIVKAGRTPSGSGDKTMKLMSASPVGNYYLYSFDGKLLQTYNVYGILLKDYIYMGDRLIAEYDHVGARFLYYTPDQINSTRVVTDNTGTVVYSVTYDPYGGIQQSSPNNTYDPQLKFSGKERDAESELDYFGARYYDRSQYRFVSVDPQYTGSVSSFNSKRLNFYSYCMNNPISFIDPDGAYPVEIVVYRIGQLPNGRIWGLVYINGEFACYSIELAYNDNKTDESCIPPGTYDGRIGQFRPETGPSFSTVKLYDGRDDVFLSTYPRTLIAFHQGKKTKGCFLIGLSIDKEMGTVSGNALQKMMERINLLGADLPPIIADVIGGFDALLSISDFPEITARVVDLRPIALNVMLLLAFRI
jgi:RHS repeat-associated protein